MSTAEKEKRFYSRLGTGIILVGAWLVPYVFAQIPAGHWAAFSLAATTIVAGIYAVGCLVYAFN
jgi:hypothetical protein